MTISASRPASGSPAPGSSLAGSWLSGLVSRAAGWRARLAPSDPVLVLHADGSQSIWLGHQRLQPVSGGKPPSFVAVEIPDDLLLHRALDLPRLSQQDVEQALLLEVRGSSPFAPEDLVWGSDVRDLDGGRRRADIVIASRTQLAAFIEGTWPDLVASGRSPEAWALSGVPAPVVIRGFGEQGRISHLASQARWDWALVLLAGVLAMVAAMTPTLQLRMQAVEAVHASESVAARVAPLVRKRDEVSALSESLRLLDAAAADRVDPAGVMEVLTRVLPDDTHLISLDIKKAKVTAAGHTTDASALLQRLSTDPQLKDVRAPTAVTRAPGATKEAFMVEFTMASLAPVSNLPAAPAPVPAAALPAPPPAPASLPAAAAPMAPTPGTTAPVAQAAPAAANASATKSPFAIGGSVR